MKGLEKEEETERKGPKNGQEGMEGKGVKTGKN